MTNIEILIERGKHICDDQKIVEISQNFNKMEKNIQDEDIDLGNDKSPEMKIYELVKNSKDVDKITRIIYLILNKKEEKAILKNEIDIINEKYKDFIYYTKDYFTKEWTWLFMIFGFINNFNENIIKSYIYNYKYIIFVVIINIYFSIL